VTTAVPHVMVLAAELAATAKSARLTASTSCAPSCVQVTSAAFGAVVLTAQRVAMAPAVALDVLE
jgi:hypothetical protein